MSDAELRRVAAAIVLRDGRALVQTRAGPGRYQGFWEFPGGGIESGEDARQAVVRECREELDLEVSVLAPFHALRWSYPRVEVAVEFFLCACDEGHEPRPVEGQELCWAGPDELAALTFLPANATVLRLLAEHLAER